MLSRITTVASLFAGTVVFFASTLVCASPAFANGADHAEIQVKHLGVHHISTVPANAGEDVQISVQELVRTNGEHARQGRHGWRHRRHDGNAQYLPPVLFIHGASVPGEAGFNFDFKDYSWARYLAKAGFDVFIMDFTGYGFSPRPQLTNPCNASSSDQEGSLIPNPLAASCEPDYPYVLTNSQSERDEIDAVVDYIRTQHHGQRVNLIGWSLGGLRAGSFASRNPDKVEKLILYASVYTSTGKSTRPTPIPNSGVPMQTQTFSKLIEDRWLSNACAEEVAEGAAQAAWNQIMSYDPLGSTWGTPPWNPISSPRGGVMRYPSWQLWGWDQDAAQKISIPTLVIVGKKDGLYSTGRTLYADLGVRNKVFVGMACATHFAIWERQHTVLQEASKDWLLTDSVAGLRRGILSADVTGKYHKETDDSQ